MPHCTATRAANRVFRLISPTPRRRRRAVRTRIPWVVENGESFPSPLTFLERAKKIRNLSVDESGPAPGARMINATTNLRRFSLLVPTGNLYLIFRYIGKKSLETVTPGKDSENYVREGGRRKSPLKEI